MTISEYMSEKGLTSVKIYFYGSGDDGGFDIETEPKTQNDKILLDFGIKVEEYLEIDYNNEGGGGNINVTLLDGQIDIEGGTFFNKLEEEDYVYNGMITKEDMGRLFKTMPDTEEFTIEYYGGGDSFDSFNHEGDIDEGYTFKLFGSEMPSFNNEGGSGKITVNLKNMAYVHVSTENYEDSDYTDLNDQQLDEILEMSLKDE